MIIYFLVSKAIPTIFYQLLTKMVRQLVACIEYVFKVSRFRLGYPEFYRAFEVFRGVFIVNLKKIFSLIINLNLKTHFQFYSFFSFPTLYFRPKWLLPPLYKTLAIAFELWITQDCDEPRTFSQEQSR